MARAGILAEGSDLHRTLVLLSVSLCVMLYSLTVTVVNVTLPQLQGALSATPDQVAWVVTLNLAATAVVTPMTGWIVARFGQRQVMLWAVVGFSISSLLCASATSLPEAASSSCARRRPPTSSSSTPSTPMRPSPSSRRSGWSGATSAPC